MEFCAIIRTAFRLRWYEARPGGDWISFPTFPESREISDLPVVPIAFWPQRNKLETLRFKRGKTLIDILGENVQGSAHMSYSSPRWQSDDPVARPTHEIDGHIVLELLILFREERNTSVITPCWALKGKRD
uniref:Uncharacterized protein n=1 Tax=Coccidioides posadasii RMSCC 3488 TaxID=454284 RepID=A0A0J6FB27_COCPO|nr:hypothetical protein CPAG_06533 [Coccidioides posadasii RMSCC 3488]